MTDKDQAKFDSLGTKLLSKNYKEKFGQIETTINFTPLALWTFQRKIIQIKSGQ